MEYEVYAFSKNSKLMVLLNSLPEHKSFESNWPWKNWIYRKKMTNRDVVVVRTDALTHGKNTDVWRHKVLFIGHEDWQGSLNALYGNLPKSVRSCTSTFNMIYGGKRECILYIHWGNTISCSTARSCPMVIHTFQPPFDPSVICQTFKFDFSLIHKTKLEFNLGKGLFVQISKQQYAYR